MTRVFVHIDVSGTGIGNGGFKMLSNFAIAASKLGYDVATFDDADRLKWTKFDWLDLPQTPFEIKSVDTIEPDDIVVTNWLSSLLNAGELVDPIRPEQVRYWDQSELLRMGDQYDLVRNWVSEHLDTIAINNRLFESYFAPLDVETILLENWLRDDLFVLDRRGKSSSNGLIGIQRDERRPSGWKNRLLSELGLRRDTDAISRRLRRRFGSDRVVHCEGSQSEVAKRMKQSDIFLFWNAIPDVMRPRGETFGLSLYEAMACGCACVARRHEGNTWLDGVLPLVDTIDEAIETIDNMDSDEISRIQGSGLTFIEERVRFNEQREAAIRQLVE